MIRFSHLQSIHHDELESSVRVLLRELRMSDTTRRQWICSETFSVDLRSTRLAGAKRACIEGAKNSVDAIEQDFTRFEVTVECIVHVPTVAVDDVVEPRPFKQCRGIRLDSAPGPLAHREEQGTFNPKVPGSRPGRPTFSLVTGLKVMKFVSNVANCVANGSVRLELMLTISRQNTALTAEVVGTRERGMPFARLPSFALVEP